MDFRIAHLVQDSIVDGPGLRTVVFVQGCPHGCPGCHNPDTHDPEGGSPYTTEQVVAELASNPLTSGVTLTGGEPMAQAAACLEIARAARARGLGVVTYTGYTFEQLLQSDDPDIGALVAISDWLIEGPFVLAQRTLSMPWRGSTNQRILDGAQSWARQKAVWVERFALQN